MTQLSYTAYSPLHAERTSCQDTRCASSALATASCPSEDAFANAASTREARVASTCAQEGRRMRITRTGAIIRHSTTRHETDRRSPTFALEASNSVSRCRRRALALSKSEAQPRMGSGGDREGLALCLTLLVGSKCFFSCPRSFGDCRNTTAKSQLIERTQIATNVSYVRLRLGLPTQPVKGLRTSLQLCVR